MGDLELAETGRDHSMRLVELSMFQLHFLQTVQTEMILVVRIIMLDFTMFHL